MYLQKKAKDTKVPVVGESPISACGLWPNYREYSRPCLKEMYFKEKIVLYITFTKHSLCFFYRVCLISELSQTFMLLLTVF